MAREASSHAGASSDMAREALSHVVLSADIRREVSSPDELNSEQEWYFYYDTDPFFQDRTPEDMGWDDERFQKHVGLTKEQLSKLFDLVVVELGDSPGQDKLKPFLLECVKTCKDRLHMQDTQRIKCRSTEKHRTSTISAIPRSRHSRCGYSRRHVAIYCGNLPAGGSSA